MRIFLIGFMGSGKTTAGMQLSKIMGFDFFDLDTEIEKKENLRVSEIFKTKGEEYFRIIEHTTLTQLFSKKKCVIATGGGTPCFFNNMAKMNENGVTVYLKVNTGTLFLRLSKSRLLRPLTANLTDIELMEFIRSHSIVRDRFYRTAHLTVDAENMDTEKIKILSKELLQKV